MERKAEEGNLVLQWNSGGSTIHIRDAYIEAEAGKVGQRLGRIGQIVAESKRHADPVSRRGK